MQRYFKEIHNFQPLEKPQEREMFLKARDGDRTAFNKLINANLRFVVSVAKKYQRQGLTLEELIAEGNVGLLKAYERFDISRNLKFITYGVWWIRQSIISAIHEHAKLIRLPSNKIVNVTKIAKAREFLTQKLGRTPHEDEIIDHLGSPAIYNDHAFSYTIIALEEPHTENEGNLHNVIPAEMSYPEKRSLEKQFKYELDLVLKEFTEREKKILYMYYGINHVRPYTLKEIGIDIGLTRERIRQIKEKVLGKLRKKHRADKLRTYIGQP